MDFMDRDELKRLLEHTVAPCVSLYMPSHRGGIEAHQQNTIRFKNLLGQADEALAARGAKPPEIKELLGPARKLLDDSDFWSHQSDGLASFLAPGVLRTYRVPIALADQVQVDERFHIKPLLPLLTINSRFWLLALSQKNLRLFRCTRHSFREVELPDTPTSRAEAVQFDDWQYMLNPGDASNERKEALQRFLHEVDRGVCALLREDTAPLVLAGVEYVLAAYREVNSYPHLLDAGVPGSPDDKNRHPKDLHEAAWELLEPRLKHAREEAAALYRQFKGQGKANVSADIREIVPAAVAGRVDTLFVSRRTPVWGHFDADSLEVALSETANGGSADLLDLAAGQTLLNNGRVFASDEALPDDSPVAALYRW